MCEIRRLATWCWRVRTLASRFCASEPKRSVTGLVVSPAVGSACGRCDAQGVAKRAAHGNAPRATSARDASRPAPADPTQAATGAHAQRLAFVTSTCETAKCRTRGPCFRDDVEKKYGIRESPMLTIALLAWACTPKPDLVCSREFAPVCVEGVQYSNMCMAHAAGYHGDCTNRIVQGPCLQNREVPPQLPVGLQCQANEIFSETGRCVPKPWSDFVSCAEEARQGACAHGSDTNAWVVEHCSITCARV